MAQTTLVEDTIRGGEDVVAALDAAGVRVTAAFWHYDPEAEDWTLVLALPDVDEAGPSAAYRRVRDAAGSALRDHRLRLSDTQVRSPADDLVVLLGKAIRTGPGLSRIRFSRNVINGAYIEDALIYRLT